MREAVALQDECAAMCASLELWRHWVDAAARGTVAGRRQPAWRAATGPPPSGSQLPAVLSAAACCLDKLQPRIEELIREHDGALAASIERHANSM